MPIEPDSDGLLQVDLQALAHAAIAGTEILAKATGPDDLYVMVFLGTPDGPNQMQCAMQANCPPKVIEHVLRTYLDALADGSLELEVRPRDLHA